MKGKQWRWKTLLAKLGKGVQGETLLLKEEWGPSFFYLFPFDTKTNVSLYVSSSTPILYMLWVMLIISINAINSFYGDAI